MEGITRESLRPLLELQRVDLALDRLRQRKADLPEQRALDELIAERNDAQKQTADRQESFDRVAHDQTRLETEVSTIEQKIAHESERLYSGDVSNPKELASIQAELDGLRRRKNHLEDQLLEVLEDREKAEAALNDVNTKLGELETKIGEATAARDAAAIEIETESATNDATRSEISTHLPEEIVELYEDLRPKKAGVAVALLDGAVCRGCGVALSPLALDTIKRSDDPIVRCENCRRILITS
jgi:hypothetical protein